MMRTRRHTLRPAFVTAVLAGLLLGTGSLVTAQDSQYPEPNEAARTDTVPDGPPARSYALVTLLFVVGGAAGVYAIVAIGRHERRRQSERAAGRPQ